MQAMQNSLQRGLRTPSQFVLFANHSRMCVVCQALAGQQRAPQKQQLQGGAVADLDSPDSPWVHAAANREHAKLVGLARDLQGHGFSAEARPCSADMGIHAQ